MTRLTTLLVLGLLAGCGTSGSSTAQLASDETSDSVAKSDPTASSLRMGTYSYASGHTLTLMLASGSHSEGTWTDDFGGCDSGHALCAGTFKLTKGSVNRYIHLTDTDFDATERFRYTISGSEDDKLVLTVSDTASSLDYAGTLTLRDAP